MARIASFRFCLVVLTAVAARVAAAQRPDSLDLSPRAPALSRSQLIEAAGDSAAPVGVVPARGPLEARGVGADHRRARVELAIGLDPPGDWLAVENRRASAVARCLEARSDPPAVGWAPWAQYDSLTSGLPLVLVQVMPMPRYGESCQHGADPANVPPVVLGPDTDVDSVAIAAGDRVARPLLQGRLALAGSYGRAWHGSRLYLRVDAVAPRADGSWPVLSLDLFRHGVALGRVDVPTSWIDRTWRAALPQRVGAANASLVRPALPTPRDPALRDVSADADVASAARVVAARSVDPRLVPDDARFASLYLSDVLTQLGDSAGARAVMRDALAETPCLTLPDRASPAQHALLESMRPPVRCSVVSTPRLLLAGAVLPGGGELAAGRRRMALLEAAATATVFGRAASLELDAGRAHNRYLAATNAYDAATLLRQANNLRHDARRTATAAAVVWGSFAVSSWVVERYHAWRTHAGRTYGALSASRSPTAAKEQP